MERFRKVVIDFDLYFPDPFRVVEFLVNVAGPELSVYISVFTFEKRPSATLSSFV